MRKKQAKYSMDEDIQKYPIFLYYEPTKEIYPADYIKTTGQYNHWVYEMHHFIPQEIRKNSFEFYKRVEHLQKLILMPRQMHNDVSDSGLSAQPFYEKWKQPKYKMIFNRKKWREGYYD